jgi:hypothetical protein
MGMIFRRRGPQGDGEANPVPAAGTMRMVKCRRCGAENRASREGCFNCGALLWVEWDPPQVIYVYVSRGASPVSQSAGEVASSVLSA